MELTKRVVAEALHGDQSEPAEEPKPRMIQAGAPPKE
jgi:hypothetical protein